MIQSPRLRPSATSSASGTPLTNADSLKLERCTERSIRVRSVIAASKSPR